MGHSMGGHGALTLFMKNPSRYKSVSAFAPVANPMNCPWGKKAFEGYFGSREECGGLWSGNDATELVRGFADRGGEEGKEGEGKGKGKGLEVLIDVGTEDNFYKQGQLLPENFMEAARGQDGVKVRFQEGYDHSYHFISTFADEHVAYHAKYLLG